MKGMEIENFKMHNMTCVISNQGTWGGGGCKGEKKHFALIID